MFVVVPVGTLTVRFQEFPEDNQDGDPGEAVVGREAIAVDDAGWEADVENAEVLDAKDEVWVDEFELKVAICQIEHLMGLG